MLSHADDYERDNQNYTIKTRTNMSVCYSTILVNKCVHCSMHINFDVVWSLIVASKTI